MSLAKSVNVISLKTIFEPEKIIFGNLSGDFIFWNSFVFAINCLLAFAHDALLPPILLAPKSRLVNPFSAAGD